MRGVPTAESMASTKADLLVDSMVGYSDVLKAATKVCLKVAYWVWMTAGSTGVTRADCWVSLSADRKEAKMAGQMV